MSRPSSWRRGIALVALAALLALPSGLAEARFNPAPAAPGGFFSGRGGFFSGLMGGLIGAGIGSLLFGHGLFGGIDGIGSIIGLLLQIALVVFLARLLIGFLRNRAASPA